MASVWEELLRITRGREPPDPAVPPAILEALDGRPSSYDIDGVWQAHYQGNPRTDQKNAFGSAEFLAGVQTIAYLAAILPVGMPRRARLLELHRKITERLANSDLLVYGGHDADETKAETNDALVVERYLYFRPKFLVRDADLAACEAITKVVWPGSPFPWAGYFPVFKVWTSSGFAAIVARLEATPVPEGRSEIDPRVSAPAVVDAMRTLHDLGELEAALFLQLLTLADAADAVLAEVNDVSAGEYKRAIATLVARNLVVAKKQPRAPRKCVLPGTWETLKPPNPAIETWKLPLYDATMLGQNVICPLGRLLPLRPIHELFGEAFSRHAAEAPGVERRAERAPAKGTSRDFVAEIAKSPEDDALRLVYADWLSDHGDPRGELITLQNQRAELEKAAHHDAEALTKLAALREAEEALLAKHRVEWTADIHPFVKDVRFDRGFVVGVTAHAPTFVKNARAILEAAPLLTELTLDAGPAGPIPTAHWRQLVACEAFARITRLDTTSDHYIAGHAELQLLLGGPHFPRLRWLRLGFHRVNQGLGLRGTALLTSSDKLGDLRFLEYPGQRAGIQSVRALLESKHLTKLQTLRLPFNGLSDAHARGLVPALEKGLAPALRVLDFANTVGTTTFITRAVQLSANTVSDETAASIAAVLAKR